MISEPVRQPDSLSLLRETRLRILEQTVVAPGPLCSHGRSSNAPTSIGISPLSPPARRLTSLHKL